MMDEEARIIWCGNLSSRCNEEILYELFLQAGPVEKVNIPKDRDGNQKNFGFVTFRHPVSVPYALGLFEGTSIYNRPLTIKARQSSPDQPLGFTSRKTHNSNMNEMAVFGNQVLMGYQMPQVGYNMMSMFAPPGIMAYPSQNHMNSYSYGKEDGYFNRNHPYARDQENNRDRDHRRDFDRYDNKGERNHRGREHQRNSRSHRSNDNRSVRNHR
ncbi:RNA-binding protein 7 [Diachasma alloeum]|uniref:RNA-binding protein 7 n=1 Tax=Diachasma alloeum TaxID=454923 RepID=UPI00073843F2|nr:RNA-binding protein 7 [Diachasma alloeum]